MESIISLLEKAKAAAKEIAKLNLQQKNELLLSIAELLAKHQAEILFENEKDLSRMSDDNPKKDRLLLNKVRIEDLAKSLGDVVKLPDPTGKLLSDATMENGLRIQKVSVPMGVVGVIYEARPNVTIDVAALCFKAGNAVVLRGGSDAEKTNEALVKIIREALVKNNVSADVIQLLPVERKHVQELLEAVKYVDIIIPRGSQELIDFVRLNSRVPTIETGAGVCHTYIESTAKLEDAARIVVNAKTQRPSVCNALDTILVDQKIAAAFLPKIIAGFTPFEVEVFADEEAYAVLKKENYPWLQRAAEGNFGREYLSQKCSVKCVGGLSEALEHIAKYSSKHSEAIVSEDAAAIERFLNEVDTAAVYANASTRFTDGGCFGLGAEIGISTQKLHARGPFALEKLVTEKWVVKGSGQVR